MRRRGAALTTVPLTTNGIKYRFVAETDSVPQMGVFPLLEVPSGNRHEALGSEQLQLFLPLWLQKSWGRKDNQWTSYGGGGYWITPGRGNQNGICRVGSCSGNFQIISLSAPRSFMKIQNKLAAIPTRSSMAVEFTILATHII
jgi:hypothetical protein